MERLIKALEDKEIPVFYVKTSGGLIVPATQGTLFIGDNMWDYFLTALLGSMGYTISNCIIQQKHHNRSQHDGDHNISNIGYWKWYSETNLKLVNENQEYFIKASQFEILSDAKKLNDIFNN